MFDSLFDYFSPTKRLLRALLNGADIETIKKLLRHPKVKIDFYGKPNPFKSARYSLLTAGLQQFHNNKVTLKPLEWQTYVQRALLAKGADPKLDPNTLFLAIHTGCITDELLNKYSSLTNNYSTFSIFGRNTKIPLLATFCLTSPAFSRELAGKLIQKDPALLQEKTKDNQPIIDFILESWMWRQGLTDEWNLSTILDVFPKEMINNSPKAHQCALSLYHTIELLEHGLDVHIKDKDKNGLLFLTLKEIYRDSSNNEYNYKVFDYLKKTNIDVNAKNNQGETILTAVLKFKERIGGSCIFHGYDTLTTPLCLAQKLVKETDIDVNLTNDAGETALICLAKQPCLKTMESFNQLEEAYQFMQLLLDRGADPFAKDNHGNTALGYIQHSELNKASKEKFYNLFSKRLHSHQSERHSITHKNISEIIITSSDTARITKHKGKQKISKNGAKERGTQN